MRTPCRDRPARQAPSPLPPAARADAADLMHPVEGGGSAAAHVPATSMAALLAGHVLRDGEIVLLILKPSLWFIAFNSARVAAAALFLLLAAKLLGDHVTHRTFHFYVEAAVFILAGRVMWAVCQWMGRLYVLTDQRVLRIAGVFNVDVFDCPLRKIARTQVVYSVKERLCRLGSIEIHPRDEATPGTIWQAVSRPVHVNEAIVAAINKAGPGGGI
jgi:hypothetical protein